MLIRQRKAEQNAICQHLFSDCTAKVLINIRTANLKFRCHGHSKCIT